MNTEKYTQRGYLMTLQAIGDGLAAINKPLDTDQSRVIAAVLAKPTDVETHMAVVDAARRERLERRLDDRRKLDVPVEVERRQGDRRSGQDRRFITTDVDVAEDRIEVGVAWETCQERAHIDNGAGEA